MPTSNTETNGTSKGFPLARLHSGVCFDVDMLTVCHSYDDCQKINYSLDNCR